MICWVFAIDLLSDFKKDGYLIGNWFYLFKEIVCGTVKLTGDIDGQSFEYQLEFEGRGKSDDTTAAAPIHRLAAKALVKDLEIEEMATDGNGRPALILLPLVRMRWMQKWNLCWFNCDANFRGAV